MQLLLPDVSTKTTATKMLYDSFSDEVVSTKLPSNRFKSLQTYLFNFTFLGLT